MDICIYIMYILMYIIYNHHHTDIHGVVVRLDETICQSNMTKPHK